MPKSVASCAQQWSQLLSEPLQNLGMPNHDEDGIGNGGTSLEQSLKMQGKWVQGCEWIISILAVYIELVIQGFFVSHQALPAGVNSQLFPNAYPCWGIKGKVGGGSMVPTIWRQTRLKGEGNFVLCYVWTSDRLNPCSMRLPCHQTPSISDFTWLSLTVQIQIQPQGVFLVCASGQAHKKGLASTPKQLTNAINYTEHGSEEGQGP